MSTSVQHISTSLDNDNISIIDMLNSSKLDKVFESQTNEKHKYTYELKQLFKQKNRSKSNKLRHNRHKHRKRQHTPQSTNSTQQFQYKSPSHFNPKNEYTRSKSATRIQSLEQIHSPNSYKHPKVHRIASWIEKLNPVDHDSNTIVDTPIPMSTHSMSRVHNNYNIGHKITWRPSLKEIYSNTLLLNALIAFMERIYCEENILFLQAIQQFKHEIDDYIKYNDLQTDEKEHEKHIDFQILSIYNAYIVSNAQYQVNLSYENLRNALNKRTVLNTLTLEQKREIFNDCVDEIERLIMSSVLSSFYDSAEFAIVAQQRNRARYDNYDSPTYTDETDTSDLFNKTHPIIDDEQDITCYKLPQRLSLSQSKSAQFDLRNSFCDIQKHKFSDPGPKPVRLKYNIKKLKSGDDHENNKKYNAAKTKIPISNINKKIKYKKDKKKLKKKKKKRLAMDDGKIKHNSDKNKIKELKKVRKIGLRKRRKSHNDSDILLMLYRKNSCKSDKQ